VNEPRSAAFEREIRRKVYARYVSLMKRHVLLRRELEQLRARARVLEERLCLQAELVELAEAVIQEGVPREDSQPATPASREDGDDQLVGD
jgi:hypothetical protein